MPAFFKKNTLEQTRFSLTEYGFLYAGLSYKFIDVLETRIYRQVLETKVLLVGSEHDHSISIVFVMRTGEQVQITEQPTWLGNSKLGKVEKIQEIYNVVSEKSFQTRVEKFVRQVDSQGYFDYAGWRFVPSDHKIINLELRRAHSTKTSRLLRSYGFVAVQGEVDGFAEKIKTRMSGSAGFGTLQDTDVIFALLKHYFGLQWQ